MLAFKVFIGSKKIKAGLNLKSNKELKQMGSKIIQYDIHFQLNSQQYLSVPDVLLKNKNIFFWHQI